MLHKRSVGEPPQKIAACEKVFPKKLTDFKFSQAKQTDHRPVVDWSEGHKRDVASAGLSTK